LKQTSSDSEKARNVLWELLLRFSEWS
jgi:hypothetical protein